MGISRVFLLACCVSTCIAGAEDPREIIRKAVNADDRYNKRAEDYTMVAKSVEKVLDSGGKIKSSTSKTRDIFYIRGERYTRLVERDGEPLPPDEERKEREKFEKRITERDRETEAQRASRLAEREKHHRKGRQFLNELPDAYIFRLLPSEKIDNRAVWVIEAEPRPDYKVRSFEGKLLTKFRGKVWIDQADYEWVKTELESIDTVSFGFFLARLAKGAHVTIEQTRLNDEVWLPKRIQIRYDARLALLKHQAGEVEETMCNFKKFQTDSRIVSISEK